ncbi:TPA: deoxyhypusine synthase [archaeon]|nr:deoxyhypusine synthase [Candidatus Naiadarchaeales archaeon SRR2090159.bin1288]
MGSKKDYLRDTVEHIDIKKHNTVELIESFGKTAFQARNLANAAKIYDDMLKDKNCSVILCLAGSLVSAGMKKVIYDLVEHNMVDAIVSTGAIVVDQDFFEGLGFKHYQGTPMVDDDELFKLEIDRIYDHYIDEDELRKCDMTIAEIANKLEPRAYSSREFIVEMGKYLDKHGKNKDSFVHAAYRKSVPIFCPAFSDSSAGFGLVHHQYHREGKPVVTLDSAKDFLELTKIKIAAGETGILMIGGGVPKNFTQDIVVAADVLGKKAKMHKYAIQLTVADERDGALSGSTLKEAHSWGKVAEGTTQMVFGEATITFPLLASYAYHKGNWKGRKGREFNKILK